MKRNHLKKYLGTLKLGGTK